MQQKKVVMNKKFIPFSRFGLFAQKRKVEDSVGSVFAIAYQDIYGRCKFVETIYRQKKQAENHKARMEEWYGGLTLVEMSNEEAIQRGLLPK